MCPNLHAHNHVNFKLFAQHKSRKKSASLGLDCTLRGNTERS